MHSIPSQSNQLIIAKNHTLAVSREPFLSSVRVMCRSQDGPDCVLLGGMLFYLLLWAWIRQWGFEGFSLRFVFMLLFLLRAIHLVAYNRVSAHVILGSGGFLLLLSVNLLVKGVGPYLVNNAIQLSYGFSALFYLSCLFRYKPDLIRSFISSSLLLVNTFMIINMIVMFFQLHESYFLINRESLINPFYKDLIAGFFGQNGTHRLTLFYAYNLLANLSVIKWRDIGRTTLLKLYLAFSLLGYGYLSTQNDNLTFLVVIPLIGFIYLAAQYSFNAHTIVGVAFVLAVLLGIVVAVLPLFDLSYLYSRINLIAQSYTEPSGPKLEDRIRILLLLVNDWNGLGFGLGLGGILFHLEPRIDDVLFGMCNMQSIIGMGGVLLLVAFAAFYAFIVVRAIHMGQHGPLWHYCAAFLLLVFLSYYTMPFSELYYAVPIMLTMQLIFHRVPYPNKSYSILGMLP